MYWIVELLAFDTFDYLLTFTLNYLLNFGIQTISLQERKLSYNINIPIK